MKSTRKSNGRNQFLGFKVRSRKKPSSSASDFKPAIWAFIFSSLTATSAYIANTLEHIRDTKLRFVNEQIEKFYGPMYALTQADKAAWDEFCGKIVPKCAQTGSYFSDGYTPTESDIRLWRVWITTVFQPFNLKMESIITENPQLAIGLEFPAPFWRLVAHTEGYKSIISEWKKSDISEKSLRTPGDNVVAGLNYPTEIINCVKDSYKALSETRGKLEDNVFLAPFVSTVTPKSCL